ncbi:hypothetical protein [Hymenobacter psychrophilus]|uniref:Uncharacterized protein n=1 Tax=Hymenobacter psychrophilus TaxID=651662 RepID=A0A1H3D232_9BACT|nr:hypothetical protein [Hymenobacter psychrophilus]SDX60523.1 hypothetical protein SAMN04488069_102198 [Hymenobacter psychrophilus]
MKKYLPLAALLVALGLILFLYQRLTNTETALKQAEQRFHDCEIVTFQLQNKLSQIKRGPVPDSLRDR